MGKYRSGKKKRQRAKNYPHQKIAPYVIDLETTEPFNFEKEVGLSAIRMQKETKKLKTNHYCKIAKAKYCILNPRPIKPDEMIQKVKPRTPADNPYEEFTPPDQVSVPPAVELGELIKAKQLTAIQKLKIGYEYRI